MFFISLLQEAEAEALMETQLEMGVEELEDTEQILVEQH
jgi:hypothetical protein